MWNVCTRVMIRSTVVWQARWMSLRDSMSSTCSLGFRIDAIVTSPLHKKANDLWKLRVEVSENHGTGERRGSKA